MKFNFIIGLISLLSFHIHAQEQTVSGKILDTENTPIIGASVFWEDSSIGVVTDLNGHFSIPFQMHSNLKITYVGFKDKSIHIMEAGDLGDLILDPDSQLDEVVVTTQQRKMSRSVNGTANTITMSSGELLKAACCNISEAFETNPAIDVNFTDAISGTKQIKMLGLTSPYILIAEENIPSVRGASQAYGLSFTPGTWVESIQVTKGAGSVVNGYESISGQINTELIKPADDRPLFVNLYGSTDARFEANIHTSYKLSDKWSSSLFLHGNTRLAKIDMNHDGFLDSPLGQQVNVMNRWQYTNLEKGWISFLTWRYMKDEKQMGEVDFDKKKDKLKTTHWGAEINTEKVDLNGKLGYVFPDMPFQSIGLQAAYSYHKQDSYFGLNPYQIQQNSLYSNLIFSSIISNTLHKFSTGLSFSVDNYKEQIAFGIDDRFDRSDTSTGAFFEYTYDNTDNFSIVAGMRMDYHNRMGAFATPRLHLRYNPWENGTLRVSAGRGKRIANIFAENQNLLASNRHFYIHADNGKIYGLDPEIAWNYGLSFSQGFYIQNRKGEIALDFYRTDFKNKIVADVDWNSNEVHYYNLRGESYANSLQVDLSYNLIDRLNLRGAYKYYDIQTDQKEGKVAQALQAKHRFFANLEYETALSPQGGQWKFDLTYNWIGKQRIPNTADKQADNRLQPYSNPFSTVNMQITKVFSDRWEIYLGGENMTNYRQDRVILGGNQPFGTDFDSSIVYAPIMGQTYYAGLRYKLN